MFPAWNSKKGFRKVHHTGRTNRKGNTTWQRSLGLRQYCIKIGMTLKWESLHELISALQKYLFVNTVSYFAKRKLYLWKHDDQHSLMSSQGPSPFEKDSKAKWKTVWSCDESNFTSFQEIIYAASSASKRGLLHILICMYI